MQTIRITHARWFIGPLIALGATGYVVPVSAQEEGGEEITEETTVEALSSQDETFARGAAEGGLFEVQLGEVVAARTRNPQIEELAKRIVGDHMKANEDLASIARELKIQIPEALSKEDRKRIEPFRSMRPEEIDPRYVQLLIQEHEQDIAAFEKQIERGRNPALVSFAEQTLPVLKEHLQLAKDAKNALDTAIATKETPAE